MQAEVREQIDRARESSEQSRNIARVRYTEDAHDSKVESLAAEVAELRLGFDRLIYAVELLAGGDAARLAAAREALHDG
jgi:hypothetical protein